MGKIFRHVLIAAFTMTIVDVMGSDTLKVNSFNSFKINDFQNLWHITENAAGMTFNLPENITDFNAGLVNGNGDFHRVMEGSNNGDWLLSTKSIRKIGKYFLSGGFAYHKLRDEGGRWNGTFDPYRGNPYILGDSVTNAIYLKESYSLSGAIATKFTPEVSAGCLLDYFVGVGAKQKDPRPENNVVRILINPGIIFHRDRFNIGANLGYCNRKEEIDYMQYITDNPDISYFAFKGFGFFAKDINMNYYRFQNEKSILGGVQFETKKTKIPSLTELKFKFGKETIDDGNSIIKERGGDWDIIDLNLKEIVRFGTGDKLQKVELNAGYFDGNGSEYTQEKVYHGNIVEYVTIATNLKFNRRIIRGDIDYTCQKLKTARQIDWIFNARVGTVNNSETYYYIPEVFTSGYTNLLGLASFEKNFYLKSFHIAPFFSASYSCNLSNSLLLSDLTEITKKQMKDIYVHDFEYQTSNLLKLDARVRCGLSGRKAGFFDQLFLDLDFGYFRPTDYNTSYSILAAKIGFMF